MKIKTLHFMMLSFLMYGWHYSANPMFITRLKSAKTMCRQTRAYITGTLGTRGLICDYNHERDKDSVARIAFEHLDALISCPGQMDRLEILNNCLLPIFNDETATRKVYLIDGKTAGFINYRFKTPLHKWSGLNAVIEHIALAKEYHGKGIGTELLSYALKDCEDKSVNRIKLRITQSPYNKGLPDFYKKFGFSYVPFSHSSSKYSFTECCEFTKRLKPHPLILLSTKLFEQLQKGKE